MIKLTCNLIIFSFLVIIMPMLRAESVPFFTDEQHYIINKNSILVFDNLQNNDLINANNNYNKEVAIEVPKRYRNAIHLNPKLYASASAQPNLLDLEYIIIQAKKQLPQLVNKKIFIIDLRQEPHAMLNGNAISWYGFKNQVSNELEKDLIKKLIEQKMVKVYKGIHKLPDGHFMPKSHLLVKPEKVISEKTMVKNLGLNYLRFLVKDHFAPESTQIDQFVQFIKTLPKNSWIHFHCRGGRGRSTTFMAMLDIIKHKNQISLEDILLRQKQIGGIALSKTKFNAERKKWKEPAALERYDFIKKFYDYVNDPKGYQSTTWSQWIKNNK